MGGVNGAGDMTYTDEEDRRRLKATSKSMAVAPQVLEQGEGTTEPVHKMDVVLQWYEQKSIHFADTARSFQAKNL